MLHSVCVVSLRPLDVECMRALQDKVNIIPIVAKSDGLTYDEVKKKKSRVNKRVFQTLVGDMSQAITFPTSCLFHCADILPLLHIFTLK